MREFFICLILSFVAIGSAYSGNIYYWKCSRCEKIFKGESLPIPPKKCKATNYQLFHIWVEMPLS